MKNTFIVITSISDQNNPVINIFANESTVREIPFILIGDTKSPLVFDLIGCDYYSVERQKSLLFKLSKILPYKHYSRKNIGYLIAIQKGAEVIIETDDDNYPTNEFWEPRKNKVNAYLINDKGWVNIYKYFSKNHIWPRGFALDHILDPLPKLENKSIIYCPIQQGLADDNPDVDAIYRLTLPLPITFIKSDSIAISNNSICPFNSQNTTWFKEAFPLLYLPSFCNFRMTDIWRSFVAQRIARTCNWSILFHNSTVTQIRNDHNLMTDFNDELSGYINNTSIVNQLNLLKLKKGINNIPYNMKICYHKLSDMNLVGKEEYNLLNAWLDDINNII